MTIKYRTKNEKEGRGRRGDRIEEEIEIKCNFSFSFLLTLPLRFWVFIKSFSAPKLILQSKGKARIILSDSPDVQK